MQWKMFFTILFVVVFFLRLNDVNAKNPIAIQSCKINECPEHLAIILKVSHDTNYHCLLLKEPDRFVLDLTHAALKTKLPHSENSYVKRLRSSDHKEYLRLVFDLKQKVKYTTRFSDDDNELIITLSPLLGGKSIALAEKTKDDPINAAEDAIDSAKKENPTTQISKSLELPPEPVLQNTSTCPSDRNIVIVIDPGHGGKDPGATGLRGAVEKDVVLKISKQLQAMLNEEPGFCAVLTRSTDYYIPLRKRLAIARKNHADMFIAVHADAYHHSHATGASVYALSQRGATSEAARWLAEKENESELGGLSDELADKDALLRSVLIDLSQTHTIESSLQIGNTVLNNLGKLGKLHHLRVEQAAFVVLKSPDIPSILVETGFLSNPFEEDRLIDPEYQHQTAYAIKEGIKQYFIKNSHNGTWFSDNRKNKKTMKVG